jgi:hypothetical protein
MTNNKKQTAIEWLIEQITLKKYPNGALLNLFITDKLMEKAKAMEREQIEEAWNGGNYAYFYFKETGRDFVDGSEYYNEIYKGGSDE